MTVDTGTEREGESIMMKGGNMAAVYWLHRISRRGQDVTRLVVALEDRSRWCFQVKHVKRVKNTLAGGLTRWDPNMVLEELPNRRPNVSWQEDSLLHHLEIIVKEVGGYDWGGEIA